ncbi:hypothetical protein ACHQM5_005362 [Ranunculus cassubicifolius]
MAKRRQTSKNSQKSKKIVDRISALPLPILHHLLSFLPVEDIVRTCALSKQWRTIWCSIHSLDLNKDLSSSNKIEFYDFVDSLLLLRDGSNIHKFHLFLEYGIGDRDALGRSRINKWIMYAIRHNVQVLDIGFAGEDVELTSQMFTCQSLKELKLSFAYLNLPTSVCLPACKSLHLCEVVIQDDQLGKALFSKMPLLETLIIEDCFFEAQKLLIISIVRLKTLVLKGDLPRSLEITTRNLSSLEIEPCKSGSLKTARFKTDLTSLMCASIMVDATCFEPITKIFGILQHTRSLTLSDLFISSFVEKLRDDLALVNCIKNPFHNLKCLKMGTTFKDGEIKVLNTILHHSLQLETIFLENIMEDYKEGYEEDDMWFAYKLDKLKCVTIQDFQGSVNEVRFVEVIMEKASALDKLIILTSKTGNESNQEMKKIGKKLIAFRRASPSVAILFQ